MTEDIPNMPQVVWNIWAESGLLTDSELRDFAVRNGLKTDALNGEFRDD